jgi:hypothetical protein
MPTEKPGKKDSLVNFDLGANGGKVILKTDAELAAWISKEQNAWSWIFSSPRGTNEQKLMETNNFFNQALSVIQQATPHREGNVEHYMQKIGNVVNILNHIYVDRQFPHSSSAMGVLIEKYRQLHGRDRGGYFASILYPPDQGHSKTQ